MKQIGILAGTFDPIHDGHIAFANEALKTGIKKVYFLVEPRPRRKQGVKAVEHRLAMAKLAIKDQPKLGLIQLEQARFNIEKTLPVLMVRFKGHRLNLLFGDDVISHIVNWPLIEELAKYTKLIIASRVDNNKQLKSKLKGFEKVTNMKFEYEFVYPNKTEFSSSKIRFDLKQNRPAAGLNNEVAKYAAKNNLYVSSD